MSLAVLLTGLAIASDLGRCDGLAGGEQLACFRVEYPAKFSKVKTACSAVPKANKRGCRVREFRKLGLAFQPAGQGGSQAGATGARASGEGAGATFLDVRIVGATISPTKTTGQDWDGMKVSPELGAADAALATQGTSLAAGKTGGTATAELLNAGTAGTAAPDVIGYVRIIGPTRPALASVAGTPMALGTVNNKVQDSYTPTFTIGAAYGNWPFLEGSRLEVSLWDADMSEHDPIGVFHVPLSALKAARDKGTIYEFPAADQTSGQVFSLRMSVMPGAGRGTQPALHGTRW